MNLLIVDDEPHARLALAGMLAENFPDLTVVGEAADVPQAVKAIRRLNPDIVFLDIEMPGYTGLELLDFFDPEEIKFQIIFVTAYSEFALRAFDLSAVDYLLKPLRLPALQRAVEKARRTLQTPDTEQSQRLGLLKNNFYEPASRKIAVSLAEGLEIVPLEDILYLKADGGYTTFVLEGKRTLLSSKNMADYERLQECGPFFRIHRSYIAHLDKVRRYSRQDGGSLLMLNGEELPVARERKQPLLDRLGGMTL
jgi:two-component system LytT family response regulator